MLLRLSKAPLFPSPRLAAPRAAKGHPCHLYYTVAYDASACDVRLRGVLRGDFAYTSVRAFRARGQRLWARAGGGAG